MHDLFAALAIWVTSVVQTGGYLGVGVLTLLENLIPPIPSELILPVAGYLVSQGQLNFIGVVVASTLGSLAGALILYGLGAYLGESRLRRVVRRYGRWIALDEADVDEAAEWFDRHGGKAVLIGRLMPAVRSIISVPAGLRRMPLAPFILYTTFGSSLWNALLVAAGWMFGDQWERLEPYLNALETASVLALAIGFTWYLWRHKGKKDRRSTEPRGSTST